MHAPFNKIASGILFVAVLPAVQAHMALWHPSTFGFTVGYEIVTPLLNMPFSRWWFHGYLDEKPSKVMTIPAGQDLEVEIACTKDSTTWGDHPNTDACPNDTGSYHAGGTAGTPKGWGDSLEANLRGCALAIAYKSDAKSVQPEDFTVMSVQEDCVRRRDTTFSIPPNLPNCPDGECTCAWFWQGQNSYMEMYMVGFRCNVQGGVDTTSYPSPAVPKRGSNITGPTQPMYWANDRSNINYTPEWTTKPSYNSDFGWTNGAQTSAFSALSIGGGSGGSHGPSTNSTSSTSSAVEDSNDSVTSSWSSLRQKPTSSETEAASAWNDSASSATASTASAWNNHAAAHVVNPTGGCKRRSRRSAHRQSV